jgi:hypothetical protein
VLQFVISVANTKSKKQCTEVVIVWEKESRPIWRGMTSSGQIDLVLSERVLPRGNMKRNGGGGGRRRLLYVLHGFS